MRRLRAEFVERIEAFVHQMLDIMNLLEARTTPPRLLAQIAAAATSIGANACEADEATSRADLVKCLSIASKELSETCFRLRLSARPALTESLELQRILATIIRRSKLPRPMPKSSTATQPTPAPNTPQPHKPRGR